MTSQVTRGSESWQCRNCGAALAPDATSCHYCASPVGTVRCEQCFQVGRAGAEFCTRCGRRMLALTDSAATNRPCPACRRPLVSGRAGDVPLASCETCGSVWLDREVFARVCRERETQAAMLVGPWMQPRQAGTSDQPAGHRYRPCPVCRNLMNRSNFAKYSGLILDTCRDHGTFFDPRELPALVHFIQGGGMDRMREREREALKEEERRLSALRRISPSSASKGTADFAFRESTLDALLRELFNR